MPYRKVYIPGVGTKVWDETGYKGLDEGMDTTAKGMSSLENTGQFPKNEGIPRDTKGGVDWFKLGLEIIPALANAIPETKLLSPLGNIGARMIGSTAAGTAVDQLHALITGEDKPLLDSTTGSGARAILGNLLPDLMFRVTPGIPSLKHNSRTTYEPTVVQHGDINTANTAQSLNKYAGTNLTEGESGGTSSSGPVMQPGPSVYVPGVGPGGSKLFGKMIPGDPVPTGTNESVFSNWNKSKVASSGNAVRDTVAEGVRKQGDTTTLRGASNTEADATGWIPTLLKAIKEISSLSTPRQSIMRLNTPLTGLAGILANLGFDTPYKQGNTSKQ